MDMFVYVICIILCWANSSLKLMPAVRYNNRDAKAYVILIVSMLYKLYQKINFHLDNYTVKSNYKDDRRRKYDKSNFIFENFNLDMLQLILESLK